MDGFVVATTPRCSQCGIHLGTCTMETEVAAFFRAESRSRQEIAQGPRRYSTASKQTNRTLVGSNETDGGRHPRPPFIDLGNDVGSD